MLPIILIDNNINRGHDTETYHFRGAHGKYAWPKEEGRGLGTCGMWNFLWRLGFHPQQLTTDALPPAQSQHLLFVDRTRPMDASTRTAINNWLLQGGKVIATGTQSAWESFFPPNFNWHTQHFPNPHAASVYVIANDKPYIISPPKWSFIEYIGQTSSKFFIGNVAGIEGERQSPARAHIRSYPQAPAIIRHDNFFYLNAQPFAGFQAWLQGQEDLSPWLEWRHRLFWLDEWVSSFYDVLLNVGIVEPTSIRPGIPQLSSTTVILRHDLDFSRDMTFLNEENKREVGATHALLKDNNTQFWIKALAPHKQHEIAFHYNTGKRSLISLINKLIHQINTTLMSNYGVIVGKGLLKQIQWAKRQGIDLKTLHRHLAFLIYPEWIDAMDYVFESSLNILGSSSLFKARVLKWGNRHVDGQNGYLTNWPDAQFPLWYPFKLAHAAKNGKILKGWEMTSLMEIEPHLLVKILDYKIKHLHQNIFTLNFHPAHANQSSFYNGGSRKNFNDILDILNERNIPISPMKNVFERINQNFNN